MLVFRGDKDWALLHLSWGQENWNSPGQNTGVGSHFLLRGIFPSQGSNPDLNSLPAELPGKLDKARRLF